MTFKKSLILIGLSVLLAACSTERYPGHAQGSQAESATDTGVRYLLGRGVPRSDTKAFYYFNQAADQGDPFAQNEVAYMYAAGKGTPRDYTKAFKYYQLAADHGLASAQYNLGVFYLRGLGTQANKELAVKWFRKSASHGFEPAKRMLARG